MTTQNTENDGTNPQGELGAVNGSASVVGVEWAVGYTTRTASLQMNGDKRAVLIEVGIRDEQRLQVLLSRALSAMAAVERDVEDMSAEDVSKYLERLSKQYVVVTPNDAITSEG